MKRDALSTVIENPAIGIMSINIIARGINLSLNGRKISKVTTIVTIIPMCIPDMASR